MSNSKEELMLKDGLIDAYNNYHMGITAENVAEKWNISRKDQDAFAVSSQSKAQDAIKNKKFADEIIKSTLLEDEHPRKDITLEGLSKLKPAFKKDGTVTPGNSSGINDGAAAVLLMEREEAEKRGLTPLVKIISWATCGVDPALMGSGPIPASKKALDKAGWSVKDLDLVELDKECINYLIEKYPEIKNKIINQDFLKLDLNRVFRNDSFAIIGNFPYNISSQIIFKVLDYRDKIPYLTGMFQKEVAERICHIPGSKKYGILSVLTQLFYKTKYLFSVNPSVFDPQPKVKSGVIELTRKTIFKLNCNEKQLFKNIKLSFQQRRKTLRNSLKILDIPFFLREDTIFDKRPEELSGKEFVEITKKISNVNS